ncbi:MAG: hypothetical protein JSU86_19570 [Phycisphaerales bacterium]|nr:MAG: hypothetical protein JSU86_19570 [Phycisphaerales bacterium]
MNAADPATLLAAVHPLTVAQTGGIDALQMVMLALAVGALAIVLLSTRRRIRESQRLSPTAARRRYAELQEEVKVSRNLEQVMLELDQLSRQIHGRIDTKLARLEAVIRDADERIDRLSRLIRTTKGESAQEFTLDREGPDEAHSAQSDIVDDRHAPIYELADSGKSPVEIARQVGKTTGEVELILALKRASENKSSRPAGRVMPLNSELQG